MIFFPCGCSFLLVIHLLPRNPPKQYFSLIKFHLTSCHSSFQPVKIFRILIQSFNLLVIFPSLVTSKWSVVRFLCFHSSRWRRSTKVPPSKPPGSGFLPGCRGSAPQLSLGSMVQPVTDTPCQLSEPLWTTSEPVSFRTSSNFCSDLSVGSLWLHAGDSWLWLPSWLSWDIPADIEAWDALRTTILPMHGQLGNARFFCHMDGAKLWAKRDYSLKIRSALSPLRHSLNSIRETSGRLDLVAIVWAILLTPISLRPMLYFLGSLVRISSHCQESTCLWCIPRNVVKDCQMTFSSQDHLGWHFSELSNSSPLVHTHEYQGHIVHNGISYSKT